jgi:hypothetical protein
MALALAPIYLRHSRSRILQILPHILNSLDVSDTSQLQSTGHYARMPNANANVSAGVALGSEECKAQLKSEKRIVRGIENLNSVTKTINKTLT